MSSTLANHRKQRHACCGFIVLCGLCGFLGSEYVMAQTPQAVDKSAENLMAVLRESNGPNQQDEALKPMGRIRTKLADGKEIELELAWFLFLGDMQIRFVFDGPGYMPNATPQDLARLNLSPPQALQLAVDNIKRVYGPPIAKAWTGGIMEVEGKSPDLDSSYFLDREFWRNLLRQHQEGIVVAVAKRGGLLFTPLTDSRAVDVLRKSIAYLYSSSEHLRVSSALYLFKDDRWTVFQPPHAQ
jgi:hypothetical protein